MITLHVTFFGLYDLHLTAGAMLTEEHLCNCFGEERWDHRSPPPLLNDKLSEHNYGYNSTWGYYPRQRVSMPTLNTAAKSFLMPQQQWKIKSDNPLVYNCYTPDWCVRATVHDRCSAALLWKQLKWSNYLQHVPRALYEYWFLIRVTIQLQAFASLNL